MTETSTETLSEKIVDEIDTLAEQDVDSTDFEARYMAYGARLRTAIRASTRYIAYTSDIGEAMRPVVPPWAVTLAYGVSWLYLTSDVGYETYKAHHRGPSPLERSNFSEPTRLSLVAVERATFQSIASMALPAFSIHTTVKLSQRFFKTVKNPKIRAWGPTFTGLALVPGLPYVFDHPVEQTTEKAFHWIRQRLVERQIGRPSNPQ